MSLGQQKFAIEETSLQSVPFHSQVSEVGSAFGKKSPCFSITSPPRQTTMLRLESSAMARPSRPRGLWAGLSSCHWPCAPSQSQVSSERIWHVSSVEPQVAPYNSPP